MEKQSNRVFKNCLNQFIRQSGYFLLFILGTIFLSLFFATAFNKIWANNIYESIGSMLSGVFGSAGALAGALAAILIALEALKISRLQYNFEFDRYIYDFINKEINPSIQKLQDLLISFSLLIFFIRASIEFRKLKNINKKSFKKYYNEQLFNKVNDFQDKLIKVLNDKFAIELLDEIIDCRKKINPEFESTSSLIFDLIDLIEKQELLKMNLKAYRYYPKGDMRDFGFVFVNPYIADMCICLFENIEKINVDTIKNKTLDEIKQNVVTTLKDDEIKQKINNNLIPINFKINPSIREVFEKLKDDRVRKLIWPRWQFND